MRLTESHLRKIIREEVAKISQRPVRRLVESLSLSDQINDAIAMSYPPEPALKRIRRHLGDGIDDQQLANTICAILMMGRNVRGELKTVCIGAQSGDPDAMSQLFDAARNSKDLKPR